MKYYEKKGMNAHQKALRELNHESDVIIIINEQHTLLPQQEELLRETYGEWATLKMPAEGCDQKRREEICVEFLFNKDVVVFVSPIPDMIKILAEKTAINGTVNDLICNGFDVQPAYDEAYSVRQVLIMMNDNREKKKLPNGKVISVTAKTGWYLA